MITAVDSLCSVLCTLSKVSDETYRNCKYFDILFISILPIPVSHKRHESHCSPNMFNNTSCHQVVGARGKVRSVRSEANDKAKKGATAPLLKYALILKSTWHFVVFITLKQTLIPISVRSKVHLGPCDVTEYLEQVAKAVVNGVMRPDRKLKGFLRVKPK